MTSEKTWRDPTPRELDDPMFNAIWDVIKSWDINVPHAYYGYCGATGNHVATILDAVAAVDGDAQWNAATDAAVEIIEDMTLQHGMCDAITAAKRIRALKRG